MYITMAQCAHRETDREQELQYLEGQYIPLY